MPSAAARRSGTDVYPVALASAALFCLVTTLVVLLARPRWGTLLLDLPLGSYLMGGAGGLVTVILSPGWARRLGSRHRARVAGFTIYRLCCALALGGAGYLAISGLSQLMALVTPDWFCYVVALLAGILESVVNEIVLRGLGFLAPREIDPRLL